ncbi:MAG: RluA family pseudouridine synthase [Cyanobacteriota bacterium]|nr:RluA family pseudouridine synthase [Cyanobacteriota bacterium]MED5383992.1 RluA family pseudouridine synthase [Cyanobacteriota bacterium]
MSAEGLAELHRDDWLLAVEKPAGLLSQPGLGMHQQDSVITRLQRNDPDLQLAHRLDRDTSGVLLLARGQDALRRCSALFARRDVHKLYVADVMGVMRGSGVIHAPLARLQRHPPRYGFHPAGRSARTRWRVRRSQWNSTRLWLVPFTGRSHQLRSHLAERGHPIVGDPIYGDGGSSRLHLHAVALAFRHPFTAQRCRVLSRNQMPCPFQQN